MVRKLCTTPPSCSLWAYSSIPRLQQPAIPFLNFYNSTPLTDTPLKQRLKKSAKLARNWREKKLILTLLWAPAGVECPYICSRHSKKYNTSFHWPSHLTRSVHEEGSSQIREASNKSGELLPLRRTWPHKARSRWAPETWTSRIPVAPSPRLPIAHSESLARWTKAKFQYHPTLLTPLAKLAAAKLLQKSALSLYLLDWFLYQNWRYHIWGGEIAIQGQEERVLHTRKLHKSHTSNVNS